MPHQHPLGRRGGAVLQPLAQQLMKGSLINQEKGMMNSHGKLHSSSADLDAVFGRFRSCGNGPSRRRFAATSSTQTA